MGYAIHQDMQEVFQNPDKWENHGRAILEERCKHKTQDKDNNKENRETNIRYSGYCEECEVSEDSSIPMINYLYPLELTSFSDDKIFEVVNKTDCTILENTETGNYFLALCGGGMDLSQDIALAYLILENWIPENLLRQVISQKDFSISKENYKILREAVIKQAEQYGQNFSEVKKRWEEVKV